MRVLIVEDDPQIVSFLEKGLRAHGYVVESVSLGAEAISRGPEQDLIVLDLGLPDMDGTAVIRQLRAEKIAVPVIVLTARGDIEDRVHGLDVGADDYLAKPFDFDELLARIRARLRAHADGPPTELNVGSLKLDLLSHEAQVDGRSVPLTVHEFSLVETLARHAGQVLSRQQLLSQVWGYDFDPNSNIVDVYVGYLRRKLGPERFQTIRGAGYRLRA